MYNSPIDICTTMPDLLKEIDRQTGEETYKAIINVGITVDKDELMRALAYDRDQYNKGLRDAMDCIVRCKACRYWCPDDDEGHCDNPDGLDNYAKPNDFCSYGERREDND